MELHRPASAVSGMALGWDTAWAVAALRLGVPLVATVPFEGHDATWHPWDRSVHAAILRAASRVVAVSPGGYAAWKMHARNRWMVDNCDAVAALWSGASTGGTAACVAYAKSVGRRVENLWPEWRKQVDIDMVSRKH